MTLSEVSGGDTGRVCALGLMKEKSRLQLCVLKAQKHAKFLQFEIKSVCSNIQAHNQPFDLYSFQYTQFHTCK